MYNGNGGRQTVMRVSRLDCPKSDNNTANIEGQSKSIVQIEQSGHDRLLAIALAAMIPCHGIRQNAEMDFDMV